MTLTGFQVQLSTGQIVGGLGDTTGVRLLDITGIRDLAAMRSGDSPRGGMHGSFAGADFLGSRTVQMTWELTLAPGGVEAALELLNAGFQVISDPTKYVLTAGEYLRQQAGVGSTLTVSAMRLMLPNRTYPFLLLGRPEKAATKVDLAYQFGRVQPVTVWDMPDGVYYDDHVVSGSAGLPTPGTGHAWGTAWPWTFGHSTGGSITLNNTGLFDAQPYFKITGPCSYPVITNATTGEKLALSIVLGASDVLGIDTQNGVLLLNNTAYRNDVVLSGSTFFTCAPGNTTIQFSSSDSAQVAGQLTAYLLPTYSLA